MNETGDDGTLEGQNLLAWARAILTDVDTGDTREFTFSDNNTAFHFAQAVAQGTGALRSGGGGIWDRTDILKETSDLWAHVHSEVCVEQAAGPAFGAVYLSRAAPLDLLARNRSISHSGQIKRDLLSSIRS